MQFDSIVHPSKNIKRKDPNMQILFTEKTSSHCTNYYSGVRPVLRADNLGKTRVKKNPPIVLCTFYSSFICISETSKFRTFGLVPCHLSQTRWETEMAYLILITGS